MSKRHLTNKHAVRNNRKHDTLVIMNAEGTPQLSHPNLHFDSAKHAYVTNNRSAIIVGAIIKELTPGERAGKV